MQSNTDILVFDSGVGGLSILHEIFHLLPQANLVFACDNAGYPYGTKTDQDLIARVDFVIKKLVEKYQPKIIVIACNSASTVALPHLRSITSTPIVGVVPAIKPAAALSKSKIIGLLATPATVKRPYTQQLITDFAKDCIVIPIGSSELVDMAENKLAGTAVDKIQLQNILTPFRHNQQLDTVVLGCTHFPLMRDEIADVLTSSVILVDSGLAIAKQTQRVVEQYKIQFNDSKQHRAVFTKNGLPHNHWLSTLGKYNIANFEYLLS